MKCVLICASAFFGAVIGAAAVAVYVLGELD